MKITNEMIVKDNDSRIREKSEKVTLPLSTEDREILMAMLQHVRDSRDPEIAERENLRPAVGIAAAQIGVLKQMIAIVIEDDEGNMNEYALVNPKIVSESVQSSYLSAGEGCLSVEEVHDGYVVRHARVTVKAYDALNDQDITIRARDYFSIVLQHEIDHFSGKLFYDRINKANPWKEVPGAIVIE